MKWYVWPLLGLGCLASSCSSDSPSTPPASRTLSFDTMEAFSSDEELVDYFLEVEALNDEMNSNNGGFGNNNGGDEVGDSDNNGASVPSPGSPDSDPRSDGITNNQEDGADEGGIVKAYGDYLVVLRRGRLFSIQVNEAGAPVNQPISQVNAYGPLGGDDTWYDEMLIHQNKIIVVGFSYREQATELGLFTINDEGEIEYKNTYFISSNDYFSSRNYASRLVEGEVILYMPYYLFLDRGELNLPQFGSVEDRTIRWVDMIQPTDIIRPIQSTLNPTLHSLVRCDLSDESINCAARGVLGPYSRNFYVTRDSVYLWVGEETYFFNTPEETDSENELRQEATVYRLSLEDDSMTAVGAYGSPVDQFSFKANDTHLNVLVTAYGFGDAMWGPEFGFGDLGFVKIPLDRFSQTDTVLTQADYVRLPGANEGYGITNRYVGDYLLYGWIWVNRDTSPSIYAYPFTATETATTSVVALEHTVERIEILNQDAAFVVGQDDDALVMTALDLRDTPAVVSSSRVSRAYQGESRSHGFFFKPSSADEEGLGMLGLPILRFSEDVASWWQYGYSSAEVMFLEVQADLNLSEMGSLASDTSLNFDDSCVASCADWYGNARPIFYQGRIFALVGYELIEGTVENREIAPVSNNFFLAR